MTRINRLVMHGFKSFAKHTALPFGNSFNAVIGPNGSGKSNVLDALCFVLGRSSSKSLRAEKSANLIYNGGKAKTPSKEAEVSIFFDNSKKTFPIPEEEIKISRIVKGSGQSVYRINNKTRTRQQVLELLSLARIDPEGYNIILQGDIIRFVEMSPLERRGLVEEISGISIYEDKKQKAMNELSKVEEKLKEAEIILSERQERLKELKKDRDQAIKYKEIVERINKNKASLLNIQIKRKEDERKEFEQRIGKHREKLESLQSEISKLKNDMNEKKTNISDINKKIESSGETEQVKIHKEVEQIKVDLATSTSKLESFRNEIEKLKQRKEQLNKNIEDIDEKISRSKQEKSELEKSLSSTQKSLTDINRKIDDFKKKNNLDTTGIEKEIDSLDKDAEERQTEIQNLRQEQQELLRKKDRLELQLQSIDEKINKVLELEKENKEDIDMLKQMREDFKKATLELNKRLNDDSSLSAQLGEARKKAMKAREDLARLEARNIGIQETLLGDIAVKKVLDQKNKIKGIYGTVSELGEVSSKYSLALEIAAGNKIKGIVVEDDKTASECIKFLKNNKYGIASFFPLNKIKPKQISANAESFKNSEGAHGLAIDLIKFDKKFNNVFSYVFGDTLVVENIDTARAIGIGKVKMATIDGDMAELSGAMQGGYRQKRAGLGFRESEIESGLKQNEQIIADSESVIKALDKRKSENEKFVDRLRQEKATLEGEIIKIEKSLHLESGDIDVNKKLKQDLTKELKDAEKRTDSINLKVSDCNNLLAKLKIKKQEMRDKISQLRNPVLIAELNAFEEKRQEFSNKILQLTSDMKNADVQLTTMLLPDKENIIKIIKQHEKEDEHFRGKIKEINDGIKQKNDVLKDKEKEEKKFYEQFKDLFTNRQKIDDIIKKLENRLEVLNEDSKQVEIKMNNVSLENARVSTELDAFNKEFEQFRGIEIFSRKPEEELRKEIKSDESFMSRVGDSINLRALEIYESVEKEYSSLLEKKERLGIEKQDVLVLMNEIETKKKDLFMKTFDVINENFKNIFSALSTKGDANLVLENKDQPFDGGLMVKVRITGNKFLDIRSLSGGEKTMTALAFIFAIQEHEPASFYILDEVDAALDKRNSEKFAKLIRKYSENAQYIIISHNDAIISESDLVYGVSMPNAEDGISKVVNLKL